MSLVVRHDVPEETFIALAKKFPQVCHFEMGEGTLIDSCWVLTAGHIGQDLKSELLTEKKPKVRCNNQSSLIEAVFIHPDFKNIEEGLNNDIALVKIKTPVRNTMPANIYLKQDETGKHIIIVGMGDTGTGITGPQNRNSITRAASNVIDGVEKSWIYFAFDPPESKNVTEFEGVSGPGDSGGPAFLMEHDSLFILGVSSFQKGQDKFGKGRYGVTEYYSRVSAFSTWIHQTIYDYPNNLPVSTASEQETSLNEYEGTYGFRKIIFKNGELFFQRENEPLILLSPKGNDLFEWSDGNTKLQFLRNDLRQITGFEIRRKNGEVIKVDRNLPVK